MNVENEIISCECKTADKIVVSCSGACDLGEISDIIARRLRADGMYKMNCLAAVAAGMESTIETFKKANLLVIDGCNVDCGKNILESADIKDYKYLRLTDLGYSKGKTPVDNDVLDNIYGKISKT